MKIMVIGNGAREHVIASAVVNSPQKSELHAFMSAKNPGIAKISKSIKLGDICDGESVTEYALEKKVGMVIIGPEAPLCAGIVDDLENNHILCVGPRKIAAQLETDKSFCRELMKEYGIEGNPRFGVFEDSEEASRFVDDLDCDVAIKPAGLTGGKGVKILGEHLEDKEDAKKYAKEIIEKKIGGLPCVVIEERLFGEEFTLQGFVDGENVVGTPMVQDHKRAFDGDVGPNTGGMGSYSDAGYILPFLTQEDYDKGLEIMGKTVRAVKKETGVPYKGFLYGQFIATANGLKLVEYNVRLGDPEAMNILPILESDFADICQRIVGGMLNNNSVKFEKKATVCKYMVPEGYPTNPKSDIEVYVDDKAIKDIGGKLYYASVRGENGKILTSKSRAIGVVGIADTITEAEEIAERSMDKIKGSLFHRRDIGTRELIQKKIDHMKKIRGF